MRRAILPLLVALVVASVAWADLLPPNSKPVSHILRIDNVKDYPDHAFFVYPRDLPRNKDGNSSVRLDDKGEANFVGNPLARRNGAFLYAIPVAMLKDNKGVPKEEWFEKPADGVLKSGKLVDQVRFGSKDDPRKLIVSRYRIEIKDGNLKALLAEEKKDKQEEEAASSDSRGMIAGGALMCAAFTGFGLVVSRYRRRNPASRAP